MRKLAFLSAAFALVAVSFYGCDRDVPTDVVAQPGQGSSPLMSMQGGNGGGALFFDNDEGGIGIGSVPENLTCIARLQPPYDDINDFKRVNPDGSEFWHIADKDVELWVNYLGTYWWRGPGRLNFTNHNMSQGGFWVFNAKGIVQLGTERHRVHCHWNTSEDDFFVRFK